MTGDFSHDDDIGRVLSGRDGVASSSGFAASVMDALEQEAGTPPPIPFPWARVLPGFIYCVGGIAVFANAEHFTTVAGIVSVAIAVVVSVVLILFSVRRGSGSV
jgi:hypothetical protein